MPWYVILHTIPKEKREDLLRYCRRAEEQDPTFKLTVLEDRFIIKSMGKDQAHRRGTLFHHRFGCYYEVIYLKKR